MAGFLPSEIPIRGDQSLPWFDPNWPWYLERLSRFALNSIFTYDPIDIDFSKVSAVAMWAGRREIHWEHCEPQQILVKHENTWLILMRHITEMELLRYFDNDIEQVNSIGQYRWPTQRYVSVGMQGEKSEFVRASNRQNDKGEYECEVVVFNSRDETTQAERVSQGIKTMIDGAENTVWRFFNGDYSVAIAAEILANWGFVQSEHWPTIVSRFPEFAEASDYLIYLNILYPDGSHPLHNRPSIKFPQTASNVTNTDGEEIDFNGTLTDNDRRILVYMMRENINHIRPVPSLDILCGALSRGDEKRAFNNLRDKGLVDAKIGAGGGRFLTSRGTAVAKYLINSLGQ